MSSNSIVFSDIFVSKVCILVFARLVIAFPIWLLISSIADWAGITDFYWAINVPSHIEASSGLMGGEGFW